MRKIIKRILVVTLLTFAVTITGIEPVSRVGWYHKTKHEQAYQRTNRRWLFNHAA